jgi:hypothetical protein
VPSGMSGIGAALAASAAAAAAAGGGSPAYSYSSNASSSTPAVLRSSGGSSAAAEQVLSSSPLLTRIAGFQDGLPQTQFTCGATAAAAGHLSLLTAALSAAPATSSNASNGEHTSDTAAAAVTVTADAPPLRIGPDALLLAALSGAPVHLLDQLYARRAVANSGNSSISSGPTEPDSAAAAAAAAVHTDANSERDAMQTSSEEAVSSDIAAPNSNNSSSSGSNAEWDAALRAVLSAAAGSGCSDTWQWACRMLQTVSAGGIAGAEQDAAAALRTCADTAARCGHLPVLQLIAKSGLNVVSEPAVLDAATAGGNSDVVTWLLSQVSAYSCNIILIVINIVSI